MTIFERIKQTAKQRGLTLNQLNDKANLKNNIIYSWKTKTPSVENVKKVADVLGVSVDYLLGNTDEMSPTQNEKANTEQEITGLFRRYAQKSDLTPEESENFTNDLKGYMEFRAQQLKEIRNEKQ